jgi:hypothetical protein
MLAKPKISIGLPFYGSFSGEWTTQTLQLVSGLSKNYDVHEIIASGVMTTDHNRNLITNEFLKSDSEWLFWIDSDTLVPLGAVERLLAVNKPLVSGLYYGKNPPHPPIAYFVHNGAFTPIDNERKWEKGEIIEVDSVGMGCMLTHRSVFENIIKNYEVLQLEGGGLMPVFKNDILGELSANGEYKKHEHDGKVYQGQYRRRMIQPTLANMKFPFFIIDNLQTEDIFFFRLAERLGYKPVLDTSVECGHLRLDPFRGADYRKIHGG